MSDDMLLDDVLDGVDLENTDTSQRSSFEIVPAGEYTVQATEGSVVRKDSGDAMIKLMFDIMEGECEGRKLFVNLNIRHSNPVAQRIATEELTELWRDAIGGGGNPPSVDHLLFKPVKVKVAIEPRKDNGEKQNRIKRYFPLAAAAPAGKPAPQPTQRQASPPPNRTTAAAPTQGNSRSPSWLKKTA